MANFNQPNQEKKQQSFGSPPSPKKQTPAPPARFSQTKPTDKAPNKEPREFDREDKPFGQPPKPNQKDYPQKPRPPKPSPVTPPGKKMISAGGGTATQWQQGRSATGHKPFSKQAPAAPKEAKKTARPSPPPPPAAKAGKTIVPPKNFRAHFVPKGAMVAIIVIIVIVALGAVGYFFFRDQVVNTYDDVVIALGIKDQEVAETAETDTKAEPTPTPTPLATLEDVVFTESSDPAAGTETYPGETITYTLNLHNKANSDIDALKVINDIPEGTEELTVISSPTGATINEDPNSVKINDISLAGGESQSIRFQVKVSEDLKEGSKITNTATLSKNGSRKISNNNTPSELSVTSVEVALGNGEEEVAVTEETTEEVIPEATPTTTPTPTPTPTPATTPTATVTPTPTVTPSTTTAPEEADDEASPEDMTTVETGGESLFLMLIMAGLTGIAGIGLIWLRKEIV